MDFIAIAMQLIHFVSFRLLSFRFMKVSMDPEKYFGTSDLYEILELDKTADIQNGL